MFHISPEANDIGEFFPHAFVLPDRFTTFLNKRLDAVSFNLFLAVDTNLLLDFELDRQTVCIPASLAKDPLALHRSKAWQHILDDTRQDMADMRLAISCWWAIVKRERITAFTLINCFLRDIVCFPEFADFLLAFHEIQVRIYFLIQTECLLTYKKPAPQ